jgi:DoxX-like family
MRTNTMVWSIQGLLAALFAFAGGVKLVLPVEAMQQGPLALPGPFLRFIGVAEVCGAVGLILPWAMGIQPRLTAIAASGLIVIMTGATIITAVGGQLAGALFPFAVGVLLTVVAYQRTRCTV